MENTTIIQIIDYVLERLYTWKDDEVERCHNIIYIAVDIHLLWSALNRVDIFKFEWHNFFFLYDIYLFFILLIGGVDL